MLSKKTDHIRINPIFSKQNAGYLTKAPLSTRNPRYLRKPASSEKIPRYLKTPALPDKNTHGIWENPPNLRNTHVIWENHKGKDFDSQRLADQWPSVLGHAQLHNRRTKGDDLEIHTPHSPQHIVRRLALQEKIWRTFLESITILLNKTYFIWGKPTLSDYNPPFLKKTYCT